MSGNRVRVGIVGCGNISSTYLTQLATFSTLDVVAVADLMPERAAAQAAAFSVPRACSPDELLAANDIDLVINLTIPAVHAEVSLAALRTGKAAYSEKPLALTRTEGLAIATVASEAGLRVGCAPDTFLGAGLQTCRRIIDEGGIGEPLGATAFMVGAGPEAWHPDPAFFYDHGAGPLFDVGVYYLTALVSLLGPVVRTSGSARISRPQRVIGSAPRRGEVIQVNVPTHVAMTLDFDSGPVASVVASFDVQASELPRMEIYGTEGTLSVPDPNTFGGPVRVRKAGETEWSGIPLVPGYEGNARGIGVADMVGAMAEGRPHLASSELALHVLDLMQAAHEASAEDRCIRPQTTCERPDPLSFPLGG